MCRLFRTEIDNEAIDLLQTHFKLEAQETEAEEALRRTAKGGALLDATRTPECPSPEKAKSVLLSQSTWTPEEQQHVQSCVYCCGFVPSLQKLLSALPLKASSDETQNPRDCS